MLSENERNELRDYIVADLPQADFESILRTNLDHEPARITPSIRYADLVQASIEKANSEGWIKNLLSVLMHARTDSNAGAFATQLAYNYLGPEGLQSLLDRVDAQFDWSVWATRMPVIARHVCLIEIDGVSAGTGLLVGPDTVLTAYHVVAPLIKNGSAVSGSGHSLVCVFDFLTMDGHDVNRTGASEPWLRVFSPMHPRELALESPPDVDPVVELDYALIQLGTKIGDTARGWTPLKTPQRPVVCFHAINISQHPAGQALKGSTGRVTTLPPNGARMRYTANTTKVSSGAPCWSVRLDLIAVHNFGGVTTSKGKENQGIPIQRIIDDIITQRGAQFIPPAPPPPPTSSTGPVPAVSTMKGRLWTLGAQYPVLNRIQLQQALHGVIDVNGSQLLNIRGPRGSGRTFSANIAQHVLRPLGHLPIVVPAVTLINRKPEEFLQELRANLSVPPPRAKVGAEFSTDASELKRQHVTDFFDALRSKYPSRSPDSLPPQQVWLIIDALDQVTLPNDTHELLAEMMLRLAEVPTLRLVLIAYDRDLPMEAEITSQTEDIVPIEKKDIKVHLEHVCEEQGVELPDARLDDLVNDVWKAGDNGEGKNLRKVALALRNVKAKIEATDGN